MTFSLWFLTVLGVVGIFLLILSVWKKSLDLMLFGFFCFAASVLSIGVLLTL